MWTAPGNPAHPQSTAPAEPPARTYSDHPAQHGKHPGSTELPTAPHAQRPVLPGPQLACDTAPTPHTTPHRPRGPGRPSTTPNPAGAAPLPNPASHPHRSAGETPTEP